MEGFRGGEDAMERVNMADVLQLLLPRRRRPENNTTNIISRHQQFYGSSTADHIGGRQAQDRGFKCKTCNRRFPTFQALGGHSTSHRKPKPGSSTGGGGGSSDVGGHEAKPKVHGCSICGLEFAMGQALGGHMRRHRGEAEAAGAPAPRRHAGTAPPPSPLAVDEGLVCLDLNQLPPSAEEEEDVELLTLGLGIRDHIPADRKVAGCMHGLL